MSLSSYTVATSVVSISDSPLYHYQYSSICDTIHNLGKYSTDYESMHQKILGLLLANYSTSGCSSVFDLQAYFLQIDVCNAEKGASKCFENRTQNHKSNNQVVGNKPVSPGYAVSFVNLHESSKNWSLPLCSHRVGLLETESECAHRQLKMLLDSPDLPFGKSLSIAVLDSKYGNAAYLSPVHEHTNLVNIVRHRSGTKVYSSAVKLSESRQGSPAQYGQGYTLILEDRIYQGTNKSGAYAKVQNSLFNLPFSDFYSQISQTSKGRKIRIEVTRWNDLKIRTKNGNNMKDKLLDLCCVRVFDDQTGELVFDKELWFSINGKRKSEISTQNAYLSYRQRYAIEPFFRFNKQNLFFQDYQTPDSQHFDNWRLIAQLAVWLLFIAEEDIKNNPKKWQKYLQIHQKVVEKDSTKLTLAQAYHSSELLFINFEKTPFLPKVANKPHGRRKGEKQSKRPTFPIVKKPKRGKMNTKTAQKTPKPDD